MSEVVRISIVTQQGNSNKVDELLTNVYQESDHSLYNRLLIHNITN